MHVSILWLRGGGVKGFLHMPLGEVNSFRVLFGKINRLRHNPLRNMPCNDHQLITPLNVVAVDSMLVSNCFFCNLLKYESSTEFNEETLLLKMIAYLTFDRNNFVHLLRNYIFNILLNHQSI